MKKTAIQLSGKTVYANPQTGNVKVGSRGPAEPAGVLYGKLAKGQARKIRKLFRSSGFGSLAGAKRAG